jgi:hypothetical protein
VSSNQRGEKIRWTARLSTSIAFIAVLLFCTVPAARADAPDQYGPEITVDQAKKIAAAAIKEAVANNSHANNRRATSIRK